MTIFGLSARCSVSYHFDVQTLLLSQKIHSEGNKLHRFILIFPAQLIMDYPKGKWVQEMRYYTYNKILDWLLHAHCAKGFILSVA